MNNKSVCLEIVEALMMVSLAPFFITGNIIYSILAGIARGCSRGVCALVRGIGMASVF